MRRADRGLRGLEDVAVRAAMPPLERRQGGTYTFVRPPRPRGREPCFVSTRRRFWGWQLERWTIEAADHRVVARIDGDLDLGNARDLVDFLVRLNALSESPVEIDLTGVTFIDSSGLQALLTVHHFLLERDSSLTIVNPSPCALRLLELTGCTRIFSVVRREMEAFTVTG
jgi:anti-anti-sigma factor